MMHVPFELNKWPYETLGFGTYLAYFSRLLSSSKSNVDFFNSKKMKSGEKLVRRYMNFVLTNLAHGQNMTNMSTFELARLLHQNPDEELNTALQFANPVQYEFGCHGEVVKAYANAWITYAKVHSWYNKRCKLKIDSIFFITFRTKVIPCHVQIIQFTIIRIIHLAVS